MRAVILAAVSSAAQAGQGTESLSEQLRVCRAACVQRGWEIVEEVRLPGQSRDYDQLDDLLAVSPKYRHLLALADGGRVDVVVTRHVDRLARTTSLFVEITSRLRRAGVQVFALNAPEEPVPPETLRRRGTPLAPLMLSWLSEEENQIRVARRHTGMKGRVRRGLSAASVPPYGYSLGGPGEPLQVVDEEAAVVRWMFQRRAEGWGYARIRKTLNEKRISPPAGKQWYDATVKRILENRTYAGQVSYAEYPQGRAQGGVPETVVAEAAHEAIVDAQTWGAAQSITQRRLRGPRKSQPDHLLVGLAKCGLCGSAMVYKRRTWARADGSRAEALSLVCSAYQRNRSCQPNHHRVEPVHRAVLSAVGQALGRHDDVLRDLARRDGDANALATSLRARVADLEARIARILDLAEAGAMTPQEAARRRGAVQEDLNEARADLARQQDVVAQAQARRERWERAAGLIGLVLARLVSPGEAADGELQFDPDAMRGAVGWVRALARGIDADTDSLPDDKRELRAKLNEAFIALAGRDAVLTGSASSPASAEDLRAALVALIDHVTLTAGEETEITWR